MTIYSTTIFRRAASVAAVAAAACLLASHALASITVVQNVNSGRPPKDLIVVFDKAAEGAKSFKPVDLKGNAQFSFADDGALVIKVTRLGSDISFPFPQEIDIAKASLVLLTTKLDGQFRTSWQGNWGQWQPYAGAKMWWGAFVIDADGQRSAGYANIDAVSPDGWLPTEMKTIRIPAVFFTKRGEGWGDPSQTNAFMITTTQVRETDERDLTLVIDRLAIAE